MKVTYLQSAIPQIVSAKELYEMEGTGILIHVSNDMYKKYIGRVYESNKNVDNYIYLINKDNPSSDRWSCAIRSWPIEDLAYEVIL